MPLSLMSIWLTLIDPSKTNSLSISLKSISWSSPSPRALGLGTCPSTRFLLHPICIIWEHLYNVIILLLICLISTLDFEILKDRVYLYLTFLADTNLYNKLKNDGKSTSPTEYINQSYTEWIFLNFTVSTISRSCQKELTLKNNK